MRFITIFYAFTKMSFFISLLLTSLQQRIKYCAIKNSFSCSEIFIFNSIPTVEASNIYGVSVLRKQLTTKSCVLFSQKIKSYTGLHCHHSQPLPKIFCFHGEQKQIDYCGTPKEMVRLVNQSKIAMLFNPLSANPSKWSNN